MHQVDCLEGQNEMQESLVEERDTKWQMEFNGFLSQMKIYMVYRLGSDELGKFNFPMDCQWYHILS